MTPPEEILEYIADLAGVEISAVLGGRQQPYLKEVRRLAVYLLVSEGRLNGAELGRVFGRTRQWACLYLASIPQPGPLDRHAVAARIERLRDSRADQVRTTGYQNSSGRGRLCYLPGLARCRVASGQSIADVATSAHLPRDTVRRLECQRSLGSPRWRPANLPAGGPQWRS